MGNPLSTIIQMLAMGAGQSSAPPIVPISPERKAAVIGGMAQPSAQTPPFMPQAGAQAPAQAPRPDISGAMMQAAQQAMNNPAAQPVPTFQGGNLGANHPNLANIINALSQGASAYGWTAMAPPERLERQKMELEKAQAMSQLAANQQYREGELEYRNKMAETAQQNAETRQAAEESQAKYREDTMKWRQDQLDTMKAVNQAKIAISQGRLDVAQKTLDQKASQFEQKFGLAMKQYGLDQAKVGLEAEGLQIKNAMVDVARTALNQRGTLEGAQAITKLQQMQLDHPILSSIFGLDDISDMVRQSQSAPIPGTGATQAIPGNVQGGTSPQAGVAAPPSKKKPAAPGGATHVYVPGQGIQPIGQH